MENLDVMVLRTLRDWRQAGKRALLTTVVRTWGSSPRPVGSIMALADDGAVVGSVSGGCIEDDLIARYSHAHANNGEGEEVPLGAPPKLVKYGITADEAHRFGLPCSSSATRSASKAASGSYSSSSSSVPPQGRPKRCASSAVMPYLTNAGGPDGKVRASPLPA